IIVSPQADENLILNDVLIIIGADVDIIRFEKKVLS
ncbi:MAG: potassium transporter Trk, partial [Psychrobacillus psychrotolerans]